MNIILRGDALLLFDKWKNERVSLVFCSLNPLFLAVTFNLRLEEFSKEFVRLARKGTHVSITLSEAQFVYLEPRELGNLEDFSGQLTSLAFEECLRINLLKIGIGCLLLSEVKGSDD
jgi:hypothetical protein